MDDILTDLRVLQVNAAVKEEGDVSGAEVLVRCRRRWSFNPNKFDIQPEAQFEA